MNPAINIADAVLQFVTINKCLLILLWQIFFFFILETIIFPGQTSDIFPSLAHMPSTVSLTPRGKLVLWARSTQPSSPKVIGHRLQ